MSHLKVKSPWSNSQAPLATKFRWLKLKQTETGLSEGLHLQVLLTGIATRNQLKNLTGKIFQILQLNQKG
jgi:hypothetical protein